MQLRRITLLFSLLAAFAIAGIAVAASGNHFNAPLAGRNEAPAVDTGARGQALFSLNEDGTELSYRLIVANIEGVTQAHIHCAPAATNGPVVVFLYGLTPATDRVNGVLAQGTITDANIVPGAANCATPITTLGDLVELIRSGNAYVNVHTATNPAGEIRGQLR